MTMDDFAILFGTGSQPPADHHHNHDGYAHDDRCLPARTLVHDLSDFSQFYGAGAMPTTHHHDEYASHDDSCLMGSGCLGLGLDAGGSVGGDKRVSTALASSGFDFMVHSTPFQHMHASTPFLESSADPNHNNSHHHNAAANQYAPRRFTPDPTLLEATSVCMLSHASLDESPENYHDLVSLDDAESEGESHLSCDSQCPGSEGACSAGTCDEATACRDENCQEPCIAPDVAHSAFILQGISGARQSPHESIEHAFQSDEGMGHFFNGQPQSFGQSAPYTSQHQTAWPYSQTNYMQATQPGQQHNGHLVSASPMPNFSRAFDASPAAPQHMAGYFSQYGPTALDQDNSFGITQSLTLDTNTSTFPMDLSPDAPYHFTNTSIQPYSQATMAILSPPPKDTDMPASVSAQSKWYRHFNTNSGITGPVLPERHNTMVHDATLDSFATGHATLDTNAMVDDYLSPPASRNSPSQSLKSPNPASSSSPLPSLPTQESFSTKSTESASQRSKAHVCLWRVSGDIVCGQQFSSNVELHKHMANTHIGELESTVEHGFVCQWKGCDRLTNKKSESKRGFETKSKIRRHIEIHTGPLEEHKCPHCDKLCPSKQALNTHLVKHSDDRPFPCPEKCGQSFKTKDSLKSHMRNAHSNEKRYICPTCGKRFKDSSNFSKHRATHAEVKRYTCVRCGRGFCRRDQLFRHSRNAYQMTNADLEKLYPEAPRGARARTEKRQHLKAVSLTERVGSVA